MQLLPMASSPDGLISARYAVITKTPDWEVLTTNKTWGGRGSPTYTPPHDPHDTLIILNIHNYNGPTRRSGRWSIFFVFFRFCFSIFHYPFLNSLQNSEYF